MKISKNGNAEIFSGTAASWVTVNSSGVFTNLRGVNNGYCIQNNGVPTLLDISAQSGTSKFIFFNSLNQVSTFGMTANSVLICDSGGVLSQVTLPQYSILVRNAGVITTLTVAEDCLIGRAGANPIQNLARTDYFNCSLTNQWGSR